MAQDKPFTVYLSVSHLNRLRKIVARENLKDSTKQHSLSGVVRTWLYQIIDRMEPEEGK